MTRRVATPDPGDRNRINEELFKIGKGAKGITYSQVSAVLRDPKHPDHYRLTTNQQKEKSNGNR